ncbi:spermidine synthase [Halothiobacillus sp. DCM-1]|uniref:spermidine synthase n=1 Tax=Halothiobacillus sp. DCM-1 TaxID=3112558 RepID=UPI003252FC30
MHGMLRFAQRDAWGLIEVRSDETGETTLYFGNDTAQSGWYPDRPSELAFGYYRALLTALALHPAPSHAMLYGLGGGAVARYLLEYTGLTVTAFDLRPTLAPIARDYFGLTLDHPRLALHFGDIADSTILARLPPCDITLLDVFDEQGMVPVPAASLNTIAEQLGDEGILCVNVWRNALNPLVTLNQTIARWFDPNPLSFPVPDRYNTVLCFRKNPWRAADIDAAIERARQWPQPVGEMLQSTLAWLARKPGRQLKPR